MPRLPRPKWRRGWTAAVELVAAFAVMVAGAWLIALWAVGVVVVVAGAGLAADAVLRDTSPPADVLAARQGAVEDVLERYRQAR